MKILREGALMNLFNLFTDSPDLSSAQEHVLDNYIEPLTTTELYYAIISQLRKTAKNKETKEILQVFLPAKSRFKRPKDIHPQLWAKYQDKMEDVIVKYMVSGGKDIIKRVQQTYAKMPDKINNKVYIGTILNEVVNPHYEVEANLKKIYDEFLKEKEDPDKKWSYEDSESARKAIDDEKLYKEVEAALFDGEPKLFDRTSRNLKILQQCEGSTAEEIIVNFLSQVL